VLNTVVAGRLWLPFSLIEIAFRNAVDRTVSHIHPAGEDWLIAAGREGDVLVAADVVGAEALRSIRDDGSPDDPIADAARMAARQVGRERISRDDLVTHLMLGFWVHRCPGALTAAEPSMDVWAGIAGELHDPFDDRDHLEKVMTRLLRTRNRVAHHEPLLFRAKHVFKKDGEAKAGAALVTSLQGAIEAFLVDVELTVETASACASTAAKYIEAVPDQVRGDIAAFEAELASELRRIRGARDARLAARDAERTTRLAKESDRS
jgi:hypothetical protein